MTQITILILSVIIGVANAKCPATDLLTPCVCNNDNILCTGTTSYDLKKIFVSLSDATILESERHFKQFYLNNTAISELVTDVLADITFEDIFIERARNLTRISSHAFNKTNNVTKKFQIRQTPIQDNDPMNYGIFHVLSQLSIVEAIEVFDTALTSIPEKAFHLMNGVQNNLHTLSISGNNRVRSVGDNAFYELPSLRVLELFYNRIDHVTQHAFDFKQRNSQNLVIALNNNRLNSSSFPDGVFAGSGHIFDLDLSNNVDIDSLEQTIFEPLLKNGTRIDINGDDLFCDCDMYWIIQNKDKYSKQLVGAKCDEIDLFAANRQEFKNCTNY